MIEYRESAERFETIAEGRTTRHSFSFGAHYDPRNTGFATLVAHNDEVLPPGTGYAEHPHADLEIVTWVLSGSLRHTSSVGSGVIGPGQVQRLSAGSGVVHAEVNEAPGASTRFLQTWVRPDESGTEPSYVAAKVDLSDSWTALAGAGGAITLGSAGTSLLVARPRRATCVQLPDSPQLHVFVAAGAVMLGERLLLPGDTARLHDEGGRDATAEQDAELVVWSFRGSAHPG